MKRFINFLKTDIKIINSYFLLLIILIILVCIGYSSYALFSFSKTSPKNYVTFNNEVWRIIGIFPVDDGTGKIESRIKIVRNDSAFSQYWDQDRSNNWTNSWLRSYLNNYLGTNAYLDSIIEKNKLMIGDAKYYLGGY